MKRHLTLCWRLKWICKHYLLLCRKLLRHVGLRLIRSWCALQILFEWRDRHENGFLEQGHLQFDFSKMGFRTETTEAKKVIMHCEHYFKMLTLLSLLSFLSNHTYYDNYFNIFTLFWLDVISACQSAWQGRDTKFWYRQQRCNRAALQPYIYK